jgi:microcystin-dependent protein
MSDPFVAEIRIFAFDFAPTGWALCDGQLIPISQNTALFSLLGTYYGGDGKSTFALPDLQDAVPLSTGSGGGLSSRGVGEMSGSETVTLLQSEIPAHNHRLNTSEADAILRLPAAQTWANGQGVQVYSSGAFDTTLSPNALAIAGGGQPHNNLMPYLTMNYCIAMQGVFPQRP